jgi:enterochelin esterase-like enzyme
LRTFPLRAISAVSFMLSLAAASVSAARDGAPGGPSGRTWFRDILSAPVERRTAAADSFISAVRRFPIVSDSLACFVCRQSPGRIITVAGDFNLWNPSADTLREIPGSGLYRLTKVFEKDARLDYKFVIDGRDWILDPLNPEVCAGGFGPNSELAMPEYRHPPEIAEPMDFPGGRLDTLTFRSRLLNNERRVIVYLPASYAAHPKPAYSALYVNDGGEYLTLGSMRRTLDHMMGGGKMREIIVVFIDPVNRNAEYWLNAGYLSALVSELVPWIDSLYRTERRPAGRGIMGASLGGLTALDAVRSYPGVFGLCASQSGAFWIEDAGIVKLLNDSKSSNLRVYLDWGSYEPEIAILNSRIADLLKSGGNTVTVRTWHEGHSWGSWRAHLGGLLSFLFPAVPPSR